MTPYYKLIEELLQGGTPKEQYEYLVKVMKLLSSIAYPRRGTEEETWEIMDVVGRINELLSYEKAIEIKEKTT